MTTQTLGKVVSAGALLGATMFCGCATDGLCPTPLHTETVGKAGELIAANETGASLRVRFSGSAEEGRFRENLARKLAEAVGVAGNVRIVTEAPYDLDVVIKPEFEVFDRDGDYVRVKCKQVFFAIRPMMTKSASIYAVKTIVPNDLPRQLGIERAKEQYVAAVEKEAVPFLEKELARLGGKMLAATEVNFKLKNDRLWPSPARLAAEVEKIDKSLASMPGIVSARNVSLGTDSAHCTYRIVYQKEQFPQGIVNAINLNLAK